MKKYTEEFGEVTFLKAFDEAFFTSYCQKPASSWFIKMFKS